MPAEREVAGLWCREVLADLSLYVDGELTPPRLGAIRAHVSGCDWCERFGGAFGVVVERLRAELATPDPLDVTDADRLHAALDALLG